VGVILYSSWRTGFSPVYVNVGLRLFIEPVKKALRPTGSDKSDPYKKRIYYPKNF
jgi:hypothetical protein